MFVFGPSIFKVYGRNRDLFIYFSVYMECNFADENKEQLSTSTSTLLLKKRSTFNYVVLTSFLVLSVIPAFLLIHKLQGCTLSVFHFFCFRNHSN